MRLPSLLTHQFYFMPPLHSAIFIHLLTSPAADGALASPLSQQMHQRRHESFGELLQAARSIGELRNCPVGALTNVL